MRGSLHAVVFLLCAAVSGCRSEQHAATVSTDTSTITFVGIPPIMEPFTNFYRGRLPDIAFSLRQGSSGMLASVDYLQSGVGDVTFTQSDIAYTALTKGTEANPTPHTNLRGLAVTWTVALHLIVGPRVNFHSLEEPSRKACRYRTAGWRYGNHRPNDSCPVGIVIRGSRGKSAS